jgi:hypothetical protein
MLARRKLFCGLENPLKNCPHPLFFTSGSKCRQRLRLRCLLFYLGQADRWPVNAKWIEVAWARVTQQIFVPNRVTSWVFEKLVQSGAQTFLLSKMMHNPYFGKEHTNIWGHFCHFWKTAQSKKSGHPVSKHVILIKNLSNCKCPTKLIALMVQRHLEDYFFEWTFGHSHNSLLTYSCSDFVLIYALKAIFFSLNSTTIHKYFDYLHYLWLLMQISIQRSPSPRAQFCPYIHFPSFPADALQPISRSKFKSPKLLTFSRRDKDMLVLISLFRASYVWNSVVKNTVLTSASCLHVHG